MIDPGWIVAFALIALDVVLVLVVNPIITKWRIKQLWNDHVELEDLNGEVIKIPYETKGKDGNPVVEMKVGPLWASVGYAVSSLVSNHVKMSLLSAKGKISRELNTVELLGQAQSLGLSEAAVAAVSFLPKKYQAVGMMIASKLMQGGVTPQSSQPSRGNRGPI